MDKFFSSLSRGVLATIVIVGGILFIVLTDPPHSVCDAQVEVFRESQNGFLFIGPDEKFRKEPAYREHFNRCKTTNAPGGCYELFLKLKHLLRNLESVPNKCLPVVAQVRPTRQVVWDALDLLVRIAWGPKPPESYYQKFAWLDAADMHLYCRLKAVALEAYGKSAWDSFREKHFAELPGAQSIPRKQVWDKMILSVNCNQYK